MALPLFDPSAAKKTLAALFTVERSTYHYFPFALSTTLHSRNDEVSIPAYRWIQGWIYQRARVVICTLVCSTRSRFKNAICSLVEPLTMDVYPYLRNRDRNYDFSRLYQSIIYIMNSYLQAKKNKSLILTICSSNPNNPHQKPSKKTSNSRTLPPTTYRKCFHPSSLPFSSPSFPSPLPSPPPAPTSRNSHPTSKLNSPPAPKSPFSISRRTQTRTLCSAGRSNPQCG